MAIAHVSVVRVTCKEQGPRNTFGQEKLFAQIMPDAITAWCVACRMPHPITKEQCAIIWEGHAYQQSEALIYCPVRAKEKLLAKIIPEGLLMHCRYCCVVHRVTKEQCFAVWNERKKEGR